MTTAAKARKEGRAYVSTSNRDGCAGMFDVTVDGADLALLVEVLDRASLEEPNPLRRREMERLYFDLRRGLV